MDHDVLIIGGGPAGLAAALTLGRASRRVLLADSGVPRNARAEHMQNVLGRDGTPPARLRADGRAELARYPTVEVRDVAVEAVEPGSATLAGGTVVTFRRLILATGVVDVMAPVDGFAERWGRTILHCPYCHGFEVRGQRLAIVGSGAHVAFIGTLLRDQYSSDIVLLTNGAEPPADPLGLPVRTEPIASIGDAATVTFADDSVLERDALFAGGPWHQHAPFAEDLGCRMTPESCVEVDDLGRTSVEHVFAAGDMARRATLPGPMAAVAAASAAGMVAGVAVDQSLHGDRVGVESPLLRVKLET